MQIWAIANQKGGVGKTTSTLCLARGLAEASQRVLLLDLDPHASLTRAFAVPTDPPPQGTHELFNGRAIIGLAMPTGVSNIDLIPAQPALATLERRSATQPGLGLALGRALQAVHARYDYVLLDCPPTLGLLMVNALAAADRLVIPTQTDPLALHGLEGMLRTAAMVERSRARALSRQILPTLYDKRTRSGTQSLEHLQTHPDAAVCPTAIPVDTRLRDAIALASPARINGRGIEAYGEALLWLLDLAQAEREAA